MNIKMGNQSKNSNVRALESLSKEFGSRLYRSAIFLSDSREEAEDIVQETLLKAFGSIQGFRGQSSLYTWLYRIFLNTVHDQRRKKYSQKKFIEKFKIESLVYPIEDLNRQLDNKQFSKSLHNALKFQKLKHQEIIVLRFYEDLKLAEIAKRLNISTGTVKSRLYHALKKIKKSIKNIEQFMDIGDQRDGGPDELP
jgi:RNA polymerase sigma-70 factor (ECF subfamily)